MQGTRVGDARSRPGPWVKMLRNWDLSGPAVGGQIWLGSDRRGAVWSVKNLPGRGIMTAGAIGTEFSEKSWAWRVGRGKETWDGRQGRKCKELYSTQVKCLFARNYRILF